ncbi:hypothetical protein [Trujillonella humicola]|uniref:hypothetical protein n=1 Tax=Trujillonella humicola TaxID=3383699 RepID=UPI003905EC82
MTTQVDQTPDVAPPRRRRPGRRTIALAVAAAVVLVALAVLLLVRGGDDAAGTPAGSTADAGPALPPAPSSAPAPEPTPEPPLEGSDALPPTQDPVALDQTAAVGDGVTVDVVGLEGIEGAATGPGNVAGPALRVTVRLTNGTPEPVSLDGTAVDLRYGFDQAPASPLEDPSQVRFSGVVEPGASAEGTYVFSVPVDARDAVTVIVGYAPGAPFVVLTGSAG